MTKIIFGFLICTILIFIAALPVTGDLHKIETKDINVIVGDYYLPPPLSIDMLLEESICRRMSVRSFTGEAVTDEELSTILWAAYGVTENGNRSIFNPDGSYSTIIYVIRSDATYKYVPEDHSLSLFKNGNYLHIGQYDENVGTVIKFGLVWDMDIESDEARGMADIGMICQNIYFDANALDLGTVTTGMGVDELSELGIPSNEKPEIIMPLGHPSPPYDFTYDPLSESNLPVVVDNTLSLEDAINNRQIIDKWDDIPLSLLEQSQLLWSSYGNSYLWDNVNNDRHRTLPSAIGIYPFEIFAANHSGVYQYSPSTHSITEILQGDKREEIKNCIEYNDIMVDTASWIIIPFYTSVSPQYITFWYYENGAIVHNVLLEATALNLTTNVVYDITNEAGLRSALGISSQTNLIPLSVIPVGNPYINITPNTPPEIPDINGPTSGNAGTAYTFTFNSVDPDGDDVYYYIKWDDGYLVVWDGPHASGTDFDIDHTYQFEGIKTISAKAKDIYGDESGWETLNVTITKYRSFNFNFNLLNWLSERFPQMFPFLRILLRI